MQFEAETEWYRNVIHCVRNDDDIYNDDYDDNNNVKKIMYLATFLILQLVLCKIKQYDTTYKHIR